ncbi:SGNH/GDSL hydrolase family protein [Amycolatopsis anabasis]|uniref:SGNH/GDSL hydrolase family protein n=1 Tax=Amycolatopsis anabasis TaxID=1840409 RepID=UPI001FE54244|nr:SGNH/GDSL hydrolase family protein [Amycolatopsis anabasis]
MRKPMRGRGARPVMVLVALVISLAGLSSAPSAFATGNWTGSWSAPPQRPAEGLFHPNWSREGFDHNSVRQTIQLSVGGRQARIRLSNVYGTKALKLSGASIARTVSGAAIEPGSSRRLTFGARDEVVVPAGGQLLSDAVWLRTSPTGHLTVTLYFAEPTGPVDYHSESSSTSYLADGDHRFDTEGTAFNRSTLSWYVMTGVDVVTPGNSGAAVVAFGDSITDGVRSTVDANNRYPDELAERMAAAGRPRPVLNAGIGGNRILDDSACFGEKAGTRLRRDVFAQPKVRTVVVLVGINDIGHSEFPFPPCIEPTSPVTARQLVAAHREIIRRLHARGIKAVGATLLPYKGAFYYTERGNQVRAEFNTWLRTSGEYDAVVDFESVMADPADRDRLRPDYDSGDGLHPSDAGYAAMAGAIDPDML